MTTSLRLGVLFTPSPLEPLWRQALAERIAEIGWATLFPTSAEDGQTEDVGHLVIVSHDVWAISACHPTTWLVMSDTPDAAAAEVARRLGEDDLSAAGRSVAASHLAWAALLAGQDFPVVDARPETIDMPWIGTVTRAPLPGRPVIAPPEPALAMFDALPIPIGASASWTPEQFVYPVGDEPNAGGPSMDMTGRIRLITAGPNIDLPPGMWRAEVRVAVDPEGGRAHLRFEWGAMLFYVVSITEITVPGEYAISLVRPWTEPEPAQMRLWIPQPLFQGRMEFLGCTVTRVADDTPETSGR